ncbi:acyl-CoA dehydrogenase [Rhodococcus sp. PAMC28707]|uniref:acyl-CoA dehydrogenase family protein n=1 Tax=unclassified Rhodococcus (in: high G+C Gram-positive bacteria) TaxID=192944 RepID=UPI00109D9D4D|nr:MULTISPECIES: acyl-CoA dehydrogenase family protein [unclassified Rhodococcus (in: high G+C Gram-positive bacteria)]QCB49724.1 acyl-CoA dehydrogenase [Rhodococcus sp. PAMC28705]QCB58584.1 acyl-CoA dehydrogenase [Rhodococcus sp. PAMC28707]
MAIDLTYSPHVQALIGTTRTFVRDEVLPIEDEFLGNFTDAGGDELRITMQQAAKKAGVFAPHAPVEYGGAGLNMSDRAPLFEEGGYSLFGPAALNIGAPDEGNVHMLAHIASGTQKEQFLAPLAAGDVRSAFAMTEPAPGAGSDPSALRSTGIKVDGGWRVDGHKWFITGADGAGFFIIMARTAGKPGDRGGATMFLAPADTEGIKVGRHIGTLDQATIGGHCEVFFDNVFVPDENVLGAVDEGFNYAQVRLGPARMTHVMRWLGAARRGHDIAVAQVAQREGFGSVLGDLGMIQKMVADNEIDIAATRALLVQACFALDQGSTASNETSIAKTFAAEAVFRIVDRSIQMCGGLGVSDDLPLARLSREIRPFRVYDGPSEVHRWAIAKRVVGAARRAAREANA